MANLKNITDLPMAESTEGLNLIVNDNGAAKQIAADKVGRVKSVNGAEPDDNGNVEIEIPEGFSGSWNDLTDKPFYTEEPVEVEVVAETTVTIPQDGDPFGFLMGPEFKHGQEYIVNWNGVQYTSKAIDFGNGFLVLGNGSLFVFDPVDNIGNNEPFFFAPIERPGMYAVFAAQPGTYTVSMKTFEESVHHLDPKYIKDMYYEYMAPNTDEVIWEQTVMTENDYAYVDWGSINVNQFLTEGATYIVTWNGTEYTCIARKDFAGNLYIGNQAIAIEVDDWPFPETIISNEPFFFYTHEPGGQYGLYIQNAGEYTVSIYGTGEKLTPRKIDYKYMPYEIVDDLDGAWEEINNLQDNRMRNYNPSGTGRFSLNRKSGTSYGQYSFAEGFDGTASGKYSHAEGNATTASGESSHAEGSETKATGTVSHAEGYLTTASKEYSHAEGKSTTASGSTSHAEGLTTEASGGVSHAEGDETVASGSASHAEGNSTIASGEHSHAQGKYNIEDSSSTYSHIVGNGKSDKNRSNAHTLDWDGNAWFAGDVYVGSTSGTNKDEGSRKLIPSPATAQVGQTIVVKTVDANGKPTDWECVDKGASSWNELEDKPFGKTEGVLYDGIISVLNEEAYFTMNGKFIEGFTYKVIFDGQEYEAVSYKYNDGDIICLEIELPNDSGLWFMNDYVSVWGIDDKEYSLTITGMMRKTLKPDDVPSIIVDDNYNEDGTLLNSVSCDGIHFPIYLTGKESDFSDPHTMRMIYKRGGGYNYLLVNDWVCVGGLQTTDIDITDLEVGVTEITVTSGLKNNPPLKAIIKSVYDNDEYAMYKILVKDGGNHCAIWCGNYKTTTPISLTYSGKQVVAWIESHNINSDNPSVTYKIERIR